MDFSFQETVKPQDSIFLLETVKPWNLMFLLHIIFFSQSNLISHKQTLRLGKLLNLCCYGCRYLPLQGRCTAFILVLYSGSFSSYISATQRVQSADKYRSCLIERQKSQPFSHLSFLPFHQQYCHVAALLQLLSQNIFSSFFRFFF